MTTPSSPTAAAGDTTNNASSSTAQPTVTPLATGADGFTDPAPAPAQAPTSPEVVRAPTSSPSSPTARLRSASIKLIHADAPLGMWAASGSTIATAPTIADIRRGTFHHDEGWNHEKVLDHHRRRASTTSSGAQSQVSRKGSGFSFGKNKRTGTNLSQLDGGISSVKEHHEEIHETEKKHGHGHKHEHKIGSHEEATVVAPGFDYTPPPKLPWTLSFRIGAISFWKWFLTPLGFCITIYGLNVVAWGGMLFLLLLNAAPDMCTPDCNDLYSPRRVWIEVDSQILNALFCVTGFGLIPWRFRDLYWLLKYRGIFTRNKESRIKGLRMLGGIHRSWFRLAGSEKWQVEGDALQDEHSPSVPLPLEKKLSAPLTGIRAPPTATWRMDFVVWMNVWNTFLQACLCGFMWGMNRFDRPSWSTGLFVALACIVAGLGGIMMGIEGKKVKKVEGVPPRSAEVLKHIEKNVISDPELLERRKRPVEQLAGAGAILASIQS